MEPGTRVRVTKSPWNAVEDGAEGTIIEIEDGPPVMYEVAGLPGAERLDERSLPFYADEVEAL